MMANKPKCIEELLLVNSLCEIARFSYLINFASTYERKECKNLLKRYHAINKLFEYPVTEYIVVRDGKKTRITIVTDSVDD